MMESIALWALDNIFKIVGAIIALFGFGVRYILKGVKDDIKATNKRVGSLETDLVDLDTKIGSRHTDVMGELRCLRGNIEKNQSDTQESINSVQSDLRNIKTEQDIHQNYNSTNLKNLEKSVGDLALEVRKNG